MSYADLVRSWIVVLAIAAGGGCGRLGFEPRHDAGGTDASPPCTGDFLVDVAADDPAEALSCVGDGCSLRSAVSQANARETSTICVAEELSIALTTQLVVTSDVTIAGSGAAICGAGTNRVFRVAAGGALELRDVDVCHGRVTDASGAGVLVESGGALHAERVVFDDHVVLAETSSQEGGAVFATGDAVVEIRSSRFTNNRAMSVIPQLGRGGAFGIRAGAAARVVIVDTVFEDNRATDVGGAMFLAIDGAALTMERLLFARNSANSGGAVDVNCFSTGTIAIDTSTFADNAGTGTIFVCGNTTMRLSFCSFRGNTGGGGLVHLDTTPGRAEWRANAIDSTLDLCSGSGTGASLDGNIATRDGTICPLGGANDRLLDPLFAALADNGGPTQTLALASDSPAIDAAGLLCPLVDQRGIARPARAACDAGAFELK